MNCGVCGDDKEAKRQLGCETPTQMPVWVDEEDRYFSCPISLIPKNVMYWYEEFSYMQTFNVPVPEFREAPNRFIEAMGYYNNWITKFSKAKPTSGTNDALGALAASKGKG